MNGARSQAINPQEGINPSVDSFLTIYSQSERSTGGTRGYDPETYVETKLDRNLIPRILNPRTKLVILTGNAGDGKTAFIQHVESLCDRKGAGVIKRTDNGCTFTLNGITYQTLYDGSQDFEGTANDAVLAAFFHELEGDKPPEGTFGKVIAINEGKLRDFILLTPQYRWLGRQVHHYLDYPGFKTHESLVFVNLNLRSVVDDTGDGRQPRPDGKERQGHGARPHLTSAPPPSACQEQPLRALHPGGHRAVLEEVLRWKEVVEIHNQRGQGRFFVIKVNSSSRHPRRGKAW